MRSLRLKSSLNILFILIQNHLSQLFLFRILSLRRTRFFIHMILLSMITQRISLNLLTLVMTILYMVTRRKSKSTRDFVMRTSQFRQLPLTLRRLLCRRQRIQSSWEMMSLIPAKSSALQSKIQEVYGLQFCLSSFLYLDLLLHTSSERRTISGITRNVRKALSLALQYWQELFFCSACS